MKSLFHNRSLQRQTPKLVLAAVALLLLFSIQPVAAYAQDESPTPPDATAPGDETPTGTPQPADTPTPTASPEASDTPEPTEAVPAEPTATTEETETPEPTETPESTSDLTPMSSTGIDLSGDPVRVIVELNLPVQPESQLMSAQAIRNQRMEIATAQNELLDEFSSLPVEVTAQLRALPYMGLKVSPAVVDLLRESPLVASVTPDRLMRMSLESSTPVIGANTAWARGYTGTGQVIAILDTGVQASHPFFEGRVVAEACFSENMCLSPNNGAYSQIGPGAASPAVCDGIEGCWHGTHVAGIAAGDGPSRRGVAPDAGIIAIQVFSLIYDSGYCGAAGTPCLSSYDIDQRAALDYIYTTFSSTYDIAAVNLSLGSSITFSSEATCNSEWGDYKAAVDNLQSIGIATIASSGNGYDKTGISAPACISSVVSVGATNDSDSVADFSNSAAILDLLAPGVSITSSVTNSAYGTAGGTSMAAPHVTGAWALLASARPQSTISEILNSLQNTGVNVTDTTNSVTTPRIQVNAAIDDVRGGPSTFVDVPPDHWAFGYIEALVDAGVTSGCGNGNYCPDEPVSRAQMAVFLERAKRGSGFTPPSASGVFNDVPTSHWAASWIEQLANDGITSGCGGGNYCPEQSVSRAQMAVFLEVGKRGTSFTPALATGMFSDVPTSHWAADWVEQLANDGITSGCGGGNYCPENAVTRAQMAVFLTKAFDLPIP